ncbi:MAG: LysM peptidoglycan-binding domain-containing protein [Verrucomicrobiota bacterium]
MKWFLKALVITLLATVVFGGGGYATYLFLMETEIKLAKDKDSPAAAAPQFVDTTLAEYQKCLQMEAAGDPLATRRAYSEFLDAYPDSSKFDEVRERLGTLQVSLLMAPRATPEKEIYVVKPGDSLTKVSHRLKTSPELLAQINQLEGVNLRVGQRLYSVPAQFSALIDRGAAKIIVLKSGEFFAQFPILSASGSARIGSQKKGSPTVLTAKVHDKPAWSAGQRLAFGDKGFQEASRWIVMQPPNHSIFAVSDAPSETVPKPASGYGIAPEAVRTLSALLQKNDSVTIR